MQLHAFDVLCRPPQDTKKIFWSFVARMLVGVVAVVAAVACAVWAEVCGPCHQPSTQSSPNEYVCRRSRLTPARHTRAWIHAISPSPLTLYGDIRACLRHKIHTVDCELIGCVVWVEL